MTYFEYEGQGHALKGDAWRAFMQRTADFFAKTCKGKCRVS